QHEEDGAVSVATLAAARPRHPPPRPPADAEQRGPEAPCNPREHGHQADKRDRTGERNDSSNGGHARRCTNRVGRNRPAVSSVNAANGSSATAQLQIASVIDARLMPANAGATTTKAALPSGPRGLGRPVCRALASPTPWSASIAG